MDWILAIEKNHEALKRILALLVAMVADHGDGGLKILPRHLHRAVVRLLRPAEAAARRLIIVAARGLTATPPRPRKPRPGSMRPILRGLGIAFVPSTDDLARDAAARRAAAQRAARPPTLSLPLFDASRVSFRRRRPAATSVPRIRGFGGGEPVPVRRPPSRDDLVSAARLLLRLRALAAALDDLPAQARRFARWRAGRDARAARDREHGGAVARNRRRRGPYDRVSALKPGHPPGWRRKPTHEVHAVLDVLHGLAFWALERPNTS